jgi:hypothetical protein
LTTLEKKARKFIGDRYSASPLVANLILDIAYCYSTAGSLSQTGQFATVGDGNPLSRLIKGEMGLDWIATTKREQIGTASLLLKRCVFACPVHSSCLMPVRPYFVGDT